MPLPALPKKVIDDENLYYEKHLEKVSRMEPPHNEYASFNLMVEGLSKDKNHLKSLNKKAKTLLRRNKKVTMSSLQKESKNQSILQLNNVGLGSDALKYFGWTIAN